MELYSVGVPFFLFYEGKEGCLRRRKDGVSGGVISYSYSYSGSVSIAMGVLFSDHISLIFMPTGQLSCLFLSFIYIFFLFFPFFFKKKKYIYISPYLFLQVGDIRIWHCIYLLIDLLWSRHMRPHYILKLGREKPESLEEFLVFNDTGF